MINTIKLMFQFPSLVDPNDTEYVQKVNEMIAILYIQVATSDLTRIHPIYLEMVNRIFNDITEYTNNLKDPVRYQVLSSMLSYFSGTIESRKNIFIDSDLIKRTINIRYKSESSVQKDYSNFYIPFLKTLCNIPYSGKAAFPLLSFFRNTIYFVTDIILLPFDNADNVLHNESYVSNKAYWKYIGSFNFIGQPFDDIIYRLAQSCVPTFSHTGGILFAEACRRAIMYTDRTRVLAIKEFSPNFPDCNDSTQAISFLLPYINYYSSLKLEDSLYLKHTASFLQINPLVLNYFMKRTGITIQERDAFNNSYLSAYQKGNIVSATEAANEDNPDDADSDTEESDGDTPDEEFGDEGEDDSDADPEADEPAKDSNIEDENETDVDADTTSDKPSDLFIPNMIELEMAGDSETIEDLLYKERVCALVETYSEDPLPDLTTEELLLLRRWCTLWIFLVSAKTTQSLLKKLKIVIEVNDNK